MNDDTGDGAGDYIDDKLLATANLSKGFKQKYNADSNYRQYFAVLAHELSHFYTAVDKDGAKPLGINVDIGGMSGQMDLQTKGSREDIEAGEASSWLLPSKGKETYERAFGTAAGDRQLESEEYPSDNSFAEPARILAAKQRDILYLQRPEIKEKILRVAEQLTDRAAGLGYKKDMYFTAAEVKKLLGLK